MIGNEERLSRGNRRSEGTSGKGRGSDGKYEELNEREMRVGKV